MMPGYFPARAPRATCVALVQLAVRDDAPDANVSRAATLVRTAPAADLYLLPELWTTGYAHAGWPGVADHHTPQALGAMRGWAAARDAWVAGSLVSRRADGALVNRLWVVGPDGATTHYDKTHLFTPMAEPLHLARGTGRVVTEVAGVPTALSICFDLRFPEMYRLDAVDGARLFLVASAWPQVRAEAQRLLARARAMENQAALVLCNRTGTGADGTAFGGGSCAIGADGTVVADAGAAEGVTIAEVDLALPARLRETFPVLPLRVAGVDWEDEEADQLAPLPLRGVRLVT